MDIERFRRNSGQGEAIVIGGESFYFKPMPLSQLPNLMDFGRITQEQGEKSIMQEDNASRLFGILKDYVVFCFPELKDNVEVRDGFILNNMSQIQEIMIRLSMPKMSGQVTEEQQSAIDKIKQDVSKQ